MLAYLGDNTLWTGAISARKHIGRAGAGRHSSSCSRYGIRLGQSPWLVGFDLLLVYDLGEALVFDEVSIIRSAMGCTAAD